MRKHVHHALKYSACVLPKPSSRRLPSRFQFRPHRGGEKLGNMRLSVAAAISHGRVFRRLGLGPESRIHLLRNLLTGLVRHERIEASWARVDEMRGYAEKLIDYGKLGDTNEQAMRMADFWLTEKDLIPKLFHVLAPRYQGQNGGYTRMLQIPNSSEQDRAKMAVIEYKGNCLPPLPLPRRDSNLTLLNQLLQGLQQDQKASIHGSHTAQTPGI
ncbi:39S ribosomal protein L17, mitochondrial [Enhydra lutris kenyoni]|uniref:Large ribosomal subunit protein bL17m n=2 Tax=Mustelidae TaxID=9655 RepID=A0A2Y9KX44_ENHLU|nr:39S ribosomal protein L17, mitochondrial [Enhydra lutris kenyoni]